jgi:hypothetical protein
MGNAATRILVGLWVLALALGPVLGDGAGRTRPGGGGSGSPSAPQPASGQATYGHGGQGHGGGGHHGGYYGGFYGSYYGHYGRYYVGWGYPYAFPYYAYAAWPWGWAHGGWPYRLVTQRIDPDAAGAVATIVQPKKAEVLVDGEYVGQARDYTGRFHLLWMAPGTHVIELRRDGYLTLRRTIDVRPASRTQISERLDKGEGLDPRSSEPPPPRSVESVAPPAPEPAPAPGSLRRGFLRLEVGPADAAVYLDGEFLANGRELGRLHGAIPVARGWHKVEVVRPGYESRSVEVDVDGEKPIRVQIDLVPAD